MAKDSDSPAGRFETGNTGGLISGFLAEEDEFDRRTLWRLGSWAAASVGAVIVALLANQSSIGLRHEQIASADLARQSLQIQSVAKESQSEARRLASAIETLNSDRDRLYSRVAVLEQGLDSVTGAIARQNSAVTSPQAASPAASPATTAAPVPPPRWPPRRLNRQRRPRNRRPRPSSPSVAATTATTAEKPPVAATTATAAEKLPVVAKASEPGPAPVSSGAQAASNAPAATPPPPLVASKSMMAPPDPAAGKLIEPSPPPKAVTAAPMPEVMASTTPAEEATEADTATPCAQTRGSANRIRGRCRRSQFAPWLARALAWASQIAVECGFDETAPDHRDQGRHQRAWHAAAAGGRTDQRRCGGGENLCRHDRK